MPVNHSGSEKENVDEDILTIGKGAYAVEIDLMQPLNPDVAPKVSAPTAAPKRDYPLRDRYRSTRNTTCMHHS